MILSFVLSFPSFPAPCCLFVSDCVFVCLFVYFSFFGRVRRQNSKFQRETDGQNQCILGTALIFKYLYFFYYDYNSRENKYRSLNRVYFSVADSISFRSLPLALFFVFCLSITLCLSVSLSLSVCLSRRLDVYCGRYGDMVGM